MGLPESQSWKPSSSRRQLHAHLHPTLLRPPSRKVPLQAAPRLLAALSTLATPVRRDPSRRQFIFRLSALRCCHRCEPKLPWRARRRRCRMRRATTMQTPLPRPPVRRMRTTRRLAQTPNHRGAHERGFRRPSRLLPRPRAKTEAPR